jgi:hypothetical protein
MIARRRVAAVLAVLAGALAHGCASQGMPPGGPPDAAPPVLLGTQPESGAVNVRRGSIVLQFDEVLREGAASGRGGSGAAGLAGLVVVSPGDGRDRVRWRRTALEIEPSGGLRPNTAYRVTLLPGLGDLRGNATAEPVELVFATGASIPTGLVEGAVFDWVAGRPAPRAVVQAFRGDDSTFRWTAFADSLGAYALRDLAPGAYHLRAFLDQDNDRRLDAREAFDSVTVTIAGIVPDTGARDFYAFVQDTVGPRIELVDATDSLALRIRFDRPTAIDWVPDTTTTFVLQRSDSSRVPTGEVLPAARLDSLLQVVREREDSLARAADTTARADTAALADTVARVTPPGVAVPPDDSAGLAPAGPRFGRPLPVSQWAIRLPEPLAPGTYRLRAIGIPGLGGARRDSEREFTVRAPAPADTSRSPAGARPPR